MANVAHPYISLMIDVGYIYQNKYLGNNKYWVCYLTCEGKDLTFLLDQGSEVRE